MTAVCRHFGACGGCSLQHLGPDEYLESKRRLILNALARQGIADSPLKEIVSVPPRSRRRATLKLENRGGVSRVGFHAPHSHELVDIEECHVLTPGLFRLARGLGEIVEPLLRTGDSANVYVVEAENGFDLSLEWNPADATELTARIASRAPKFGIIRSVLGRELLYQTAIPHIIFGKARVALSPGAFLQPTREGEAILQARVGEAVGKAKRIADLFSGCGTFALRLAGHARVHAFDSDRPMLDALAAAARAASGLKPVTIERRDLFKVPLTPAELREFDAVVLDPPRAGALAQANQLPQSTVSRIAYVSCNAASFARDAQVLIDGGFRMDWLVAVDQFLWSAHVELAAAFSR